MLTNVRITRNVHRRFEQLPGRADGLLDLPERAASMEAERIQRPDLRQRRQLVAPHRCFCDQIVYRTKSAFGVRRSMLGVRRSVATGRFAAQRHTWRLRIPFARTDVAERTVRRGFFEHRWIITPALRASDFGSSAERRAPSAGVVRGFSSPEPRVPSPG